MMKRRRTLARSTVLRASTAPLLAQIANKRKQPARTGDGVVARSDVMKFE
jgi:hypothetical protein